MRYIEYILGDYETALADNTFCDREQAAFNAADNAALATVYRDYGVGLYESISQDLRQEMRAEATRRRVEAIGF